MGNYVGTLEAWGGLNVSEIAPRLVDFGEVPVVYADDVASVEVHGGIVRITYCEHRMEAGECVAVPVLTVVRPLENVQKGPVLTMLRACGQSSQSVELTH